VVLADYATVRSCRQGEGKPLYMSVACSPCRQVEGSLVTARKTALVLRQVIAAERKPAPYLASQLIELVKNYGRKLIAANPTGGL
jgi:translation initiation factor 2B subunit (eIF-2B alpha/beta/delta family)